MSKDGNTTIKNAAKAREVFNKIMFTQEQERDAWHQLSKISQEVLAGEKHVYQFFAAYREYLESRNVISPYRETLYNMVCIAAKQEEWGKNE